MSWTIHNLRKFAGPSHTPLPPLPAGGPSLVGCPRLLIQYVRSHHPYLKAVSSICNEVDKYKGKKSSIISHAGSCSMQKYEKYLVWISITRRTTVTIAVDDDCTLKDTCWEEKAIMHWQELRRLRPSVGERIKWQVSGRGVQKYRPVTRGMRARHAHDTQWTWQGIWNHAKMDVNNVSRASVRTGV
jgi:hypothetical protein